MKKFKNFWKYLTTTILLLLGLCCVGILFLFFVPNSSLFGITYISKNEEVFSSSYDLTNQSLSAIQTVSVNSNNYQVKILEADSNAVSLKIHNQIFGFTTKSHTELNIAERVEQNKIVFDISEPTGMLVKGSSIIELKVPTNKALNLNLKNNNAETSLDLQNAKLNDFNYSTKSGNLTFNSGSINGLINLTLGRAKFSIADDVSTNNNTVSLNMSSGSFNCGNKSFNKIDLQSSTSGVIRAYSCEELQSTNADAGGSITINEVGNAYVVGGDTNVRIGILTSGIIDIKKTGKITINETVGRVNLTTNSGDISVNLSNFELICTTQSGDIRVNNAIKVVSAETKSGNVYVNFEFEGNDNHYQEDDPILKDNRRFWGKTLDGSIRVYGVENVTIEIQHGGKGNAYVYMENVLGKNNSIVSDRGNVYVQVKELTRDIMPNGWSHFALDAHTNSGSTRVHFTQMVEENGKTDKDISEIINPNGYDGSNSLTITTNSGSITVVDQIIAGL